MKGAHLGFVALAVGGQRIGRLGDELARQCYRIIQPALNLRYGSQPDMQPFCALLPELEAGASGAQERFIGAWNDFLATHGY